MKISDFTKTYHTNEEKIDKKKKSIERLQKQVEKLQKKNGWIGVIIKPIAQEISKIIEYPVWDVLGPFGQDAEVSIHLAKDEESYKNVSNRKSITFVPEFDVSANTIKLCVKDYTVNTGKFEKGTYGEINNMNYPSVEVTNLSVEELVKEWIA